MKPIRTRTHKGIVLISVFIVVAIVAGLSVALYSRMVNELRLARIEAASTQAFYEAEKGIAYAYYEVMNTGYVWRTHDWTDNSYTTLQAVAAPSKIHGDCQFDASGYYVPISTAVGDFAVKAFPDPNKPSITILRSMGIDRSFGPGNEIERVIEYRASKQGIYDFFYYTPNDLNLATLRDSGTPNVNADGGGIHANGRISLDRHLLVRDCYELSTPKDIYYTGSGYPRPYYADSYGGDAGKAPVPTLHKRDGFDEDKIIGYNHLWLTEFGDDAAPWGHYNTNTDADGNEYKTFAWNTDAGNWRSWPPNAYQDIEAHFTGDNQAVNKVDVDSSTGVIDSFGDAQMNKYNVWIKPYKLDDSGNPIGTAKYAEIPAELDEQYTWDKYNHSAIAGESAISFYTRGLNENGTETENIALAGADDHWRLKEVGGSWNVYHSNNPSDPSYFEILNDPAHEYWTKLGYADNWNNRINPEILDAVYGNDMETIDDMTRLNSLKQETKWKDFLETADVGLDDGLNDIVMDGKTGGEYLEPPSFSRTYWRKAKNFGLYIGIQNEANEPPISGETNKATIDSSIDDAVTMLNNNPDSITVAKKICAISAHSGQWECTLEIDVGEMDRAGIAPDNGIIYSRVPIRLSNAAVLPQNVKGFTVLGEKGIRIKGDFNYVVEDEVEDRTKWVKAALISRMGVSTISNNYTDPQHLPALTSYLNYPYLRVAEQTLDNYEEVTIGTGIDNEQWVASGSLCVDNAGWKELNDGTKVWVWDPDGDGIRGDGIYDNYTYISPADQIALKNKIAQKDAAYRTVFTALGNDPNASADYIDPLGNDTVGGWGRMAQPPDRSYNYNYLSSGYHGNLTNPGVAENWSAKDPITNQSYTRSLNGAFIKLDKRDMGTDKGRWLQQADGTRIWQWIPDGEPDDGFTAPSSEFAAFYNRGRTAGGSCSSYLGTSSGGSSSSYDRTFHTAARTPADIFFSSMEPVWIELEVADFYEFEP